jgi:hypothetical protein
MHYFNILPTTTLVAAAYAAVTPSSTLSSVPLPSISPIPINNDGSVKRLLASPQAMPTKLTEELFFEVDHAIRQDLWESAAAASTTPTATPDEIADLTFQIAVEMVRAAHNAAEEVAAQERDVFLRQKEKEDKSKNEHCWKCIFNCMFC